MQEPALAPTLAGRTIAVPESRELDVFAAMLERRGARVIRCPLVAILDAPDPTVVLTWIREFTAGSCDDLILLTGEGLRRLLSCIDTHGPELRDDFLRRLTSVRKIVRGPKPARVLRELGLRPDIEAIAPTTDGVMQTLADVDLSGRTVGVQLYGGDPNRRLADFLQARGARVCVVAPYVYADRSADDAVVDLLHAIARGDVDVIAFTSKSQVDRLLTIASTHGLDRALTHTRIAAVGPVVRDVLQDRGFPVQFMPEQSWFMKPLVRALEEKLGPAGH